jgi:O-antigen/teichoic acid export membrane protein
MPQTVSESGSEQLQTGEKWAERFFINVLWSWLGVVASFFTGFFLSPYIIRRLGDQRYGIWALAFAFIDYYTLFDFGFKTAVVNLISGLHARREDDEINEVINTALFYFIALGFLIFCLTWFSAPQLHRFFKISPEYQHDFVILVRIIAVGWSLAISLNVFQGAIEGFQRFKAANHIWIVSLIIRSGGSALMLFLGHGLIAMGVVVTIAQFVSFGLIFLTVRRAFPAMRLSPALARIAMWKRIASYGVHSFVAYVGNTLITQGPPILVGHFQSEAFVGYYTLPSRLLQYVVELVTRIGYVTMPNTAELAAEGKNKEIMLLGTYLNRYCLVLFLPMTIFLTVYGRELIRVWLGAGFAEHAAPLLPVFVLSTSLAVAGQFNSSQILFGLAKHGNYSKALIAEGALALGAMAIILPRYGIFGAACASAGFAILNRAIVTPFLLCRLMHYSVVRYLRDIYAIPLATGVPALAYAFWIKMHWLGGRNWFELIACIAVIAAPYYVVSYFTAVEPGHRALLRQWIHARSGRFSRLWAPA